jgi:ribonuclease III
VDEEARVAERLAPVLGHRFADPALLVEALTHASAVPRAKAHRVRGYERLEFLGDRVLGLIVAELLWRRFPDEAEGALTRRHTHLVRRETLAELARGIGLSAHIIMSAGEAGAQTQGNPAILADVCEAVIAALYLDGGLAAAHAFIEAHWGRLIEADAAPPRDPKTALQEWAQARGRGLPRYATLRVEGPAHARRFTVSASVEGLEAQSATGTSKRAAEVAAAAALLAALPGEEGRRR